MITRSKYRVQREKIWVLAFRFGLCSSFDKYNESDVLITIQNKSTSKYLH